MNDTTADLDTEVRRLRVRIIGLRERDLAEVGERSSVTRRESIRVALSAIAGLTADCRPVPNLGDSSLSDQIVVLLEHGRDSAEALTGPDRTARLTALVDIAMALRRELA